MDHAKERICSRIDAIANELAAINCFLKENPETAYQEFKACAHLSDILNERGFDVETGVGGIETSFVARPSGSPPVRPTVAFLAEYDALPLIGHGCGHNMIASAGIGAALALLPLLGDLTGSLAVVGTPAEEGGGGKIRLAEQGVFDDLDVAMMFHPGLLNLPGRDFLGRIRFKLEFFGKAAHPTGTPDHGRNALDAIVIAYTSMNALRQHLRPDGKIHGIITHGGEAPNIIPDYAAGVFYVRAGSRGYRDEIFERVKQCAEGAALATGTRVAFSVDHPNIDPIRRYPSLDAAVKSNMEALGVAVDEDDGRRGSSDIGNLSHYLPAIHPFLAIVSPESGIPGHSAAFCEATTSSKGNEVLLNAAKMLAMTAYDYLTSDLLRKRVADEFKGNT